MQHTSKQIEQQHFFLKKAKGPFLLKIRTTIWPKKYDWKKYISRLARETKKNGQRL